MASPFQVFRKNQKSMVVVLAILAMFGFVVIPTIMQSMGTMGPMRQAGDVVTTNELGNLSERGLQSLRRDRQALVQLLTQLRGQMTLAHIRQKMPGLTDEQLAHVLSPDPNNLDEADKSREILDDLDTETLAQLTMVFERELFDEALIDTWLLAGRAEQLGMQVSDKTINTFLSQLTQGRISKAQLADTLGSLGISDDDLFRAIERELLALRFRVTFLISLAGMPPGQQFEYFSRLRRTNTIEAIPVAVADFTDQVADPDEATLRAFFEEYKETEANPASPDPGFRVPKRIQVEYLKAEYEKFIDRVEVTEEEIAAYYLEHKEEYVEVFLPEMDEETPVIREASDLTVDEKEETPAESQSMEAVEPAVEETPGDAPSDEKADTDEDASEDESDTKAAESEETSSRESTWPFRLASYPQEAEEAEESDPIEEPELPKLVPAQPESEAATEAAEPMTEAVSPEETPETPIAEDPATESEDAEAEEEEVAYQPLEEVRDDIRTAIARLKAGQAIEDLLEQIKADIGTYRTAKISYDVRNVESGGTLAAPVKPDLKALAQEHDISAYETGLISALEMSEVDIASSQIGGQTGFLEKNYGQSGKSVVLRPEISRDDNNDYYLYWILEGATERVPDFDAEDVPEEEREAERARIHQQVLDAWKMIQARDLAAGEAERLAEKARAAEGKSLAELFTEDESVQIVETAPFSWWTYGTMPVYLAQQYYRRPPQRSVVEGIDSPGDTFMAKVFGLEENGIGTAANDPRTITYVIRVAESNPLPETLTTMFLAERTMNFWLLATDDRGEAEVAWLDRIKADVAFELQKKLDPPPRR